MTASTALPRLNGILETCLYVADLERSARFYRGLFGFTEVDRGDRLIALSVADRNCCCSLRRELRR